MTAGTYDSINRTARLAGGLYLSLAVFGFFSFVYVPSVLVVHGDAAATSRNIVGSELLFRAGTISHLITEIVVVFLALAMYRLLRPVNKDHAVLMVVLVLLGVPVSVLSEINHFAAVSLLTNADDGAFTAAQLQAQAMLLLDMRRSGVLIAQIFWGLWSLPLAALVFRSGFLPKLLAIPVLIAAAGYLIDSSTQLLSPGLATISQFTAVAEMLLPLWLLVKGVAVERWQAVAAA